MRRTTIAATALLALTSFAQQPLQCMNPDMLNGLVFLGRTDRMMTITRASTGFMGAFRAPEGFTLIGTGVRPIGMSVVAYKTALPGGKAYEALLTALGAEGWAPESSQRAGSTFNVAGAPREGVVCRNGERLTLMANETGAVTYVNINQFPDGRPRACNEPDPAMGRPLGMDFNLVPRFQFPEGTSIGQAMSGGGGSNTVYTTGSRIISAETATRLVEHLASQIENQGWKPDSGWSGSANAGSTWRKVNDGQTITGVLQIARTSEGTYDVDFTVLSAN